MGISGAKSKLRAGGSKPEGWFKLSNTRWEDRTMQASGDEFTVLVSDGISADSDSTTEILLFLGKTNKVGDYVRVDDGALVSVDEDTDYEIPENSGVGRFFASLTDAGVSDKTMDKVGDKPGVLDGLVVLIEQEVQLDKDGEPKKNDKGYPYTNTIVAKLGKEKDLKAGTGAKKSSKKAAPKKDKKVADDDDEDEDDEEEDDEEESDDDEDDDSDDDDDADDDDDEDDEDEDEDEKPAPKKGAKAAAGKGKGRGKK